MSPNQAVAEDSIWRHNVHGNAYLGALLECVQLSYSWFAGSLSPRLARLHRLLYSPGIAGSSTSDEDYWRWACQSTGIDQVIPGDGI